MFFKVVDVSKFYNLFFKFSKVNSTSILPTYNILNKIVAEDIIATEDFPPFNRACMDGYAVRAQDTFGGSESNPVYLNIVGAVSIDKIPDFSISSLECAKIVTGAPMPRGADAVVMVEYTEVVAHGEVEVRCSVSPGENVILKGEDFRIGDILIEKGTRIRPQEIGILMEFGIVECRVYEPLKVGIISTGNEIVPPDTLDLPIGKIRDVNSYVLASIVKMNNCEPIFYGIVPDEKHMLIDAIEKALSQCDVTLISGGSSIGVKDLTEEAITSFEDSKILCHGVAISPGKPTLLASVKGKPVIGLPGQVTSAQIVMQILISPFLRFLSGEKEYLSRRYFPTVKARLLQNIPSKKGREDYVRVKLVEKSNEVFAEPIFAKSGIIKSLIKSHGLVKVPPLSEGMLKDTVVDVLIF